MEHIKITEISRTSQQILGNSTWKFDSDHMDNSCFTFLFLLVQDKSHAKILIRTTTNYWIQFSLSRNSFVFLCTLPLICNYLSTRTFFKVLKPPLCCSTVVLFLCWFSNFSSRYLPLKIPLRMVIFFFFQVFCILEAFQSSLGLGPRCFEVSGNNPIFPIASF